MPHAAVPSRSSRHRSSRHRRAATSTPAGRRSVCPATDPALPPHLPARGAEANGPSPLDPEPEGGLRRSGSPCGQGDRRRYAQRVSRVQHLGQLLVVLGQQLIVAVDGDLPRTPMASSSTSSCRSNSAGNASRLATVAQMNCRKCFRPAVVVSPRTTPPGVLFAKSIPHGRPRRSPTGGLKAGGSSGSHGWRLCDRGDGSLVSAPAAPRAGDRRRGPQPPGSRRRGGGRRRHRLARGSP